MQSRKRLVRAAVGFVAVAIVFAAQAGIASANKSGGSSSSATYPPSPGWCVGKNAVESVITSVNGKKVSGFWTHVHEGDHLRADVKVRTQCNGAQIGLAAYQTASDHYDGATVGQQRLFKSDVKMFAGGETKTLEIDVDTCFFQVDLFTGKVLTKLTEQNNYAMPNNDLIDTAVGGTRICRSATTTTALPTTTTVRSTTTTARPTTTTTVRPTTTTTQPVTTDECTKRPKNGLIAYDYTIKGADGVERTERRLHGNVKSGDEVTVHFTVADNCEERYSLVSYESPNDDFTPDGIVNQKFFESDTGVFAAGDHELTVKVPECFFQIDFIRGEVIEDLAAAGRGNWYAKQGRLIDSDTGGSGDACIEVSSSTVTPTTTAPAAAEVLGQTITNPQFAQTGAPVVPELLLGILLISAGVGVLQFRRSQYDV